MRKIILIFLGVFCLNNSFCQINTTLFGFGYRPIFSSKFLRTGPKDFDNNGISFSVAQGSGYSTGAFVRRGVTKKLSLETGILYTKRNYNFTLVDSSFVGNGSYSIIGYEIPLKALVFIQLDQKLWMNVALGSSLDIFPSDIFSFRDYYLNYAARNSKINLGVLANIGVEYRTQKSGILYFGFSYHRSVGSIYNSIIEYYPQRKFDNLPFSTGKTSLEGDYLTVDLRYYFHEDPEKKKNRKKKN